MIFPAPLTRHPSEGWGPALATTFHFKSGMPAFAGMTGKMNNANHKFDETLSFTPCFDAAGLISAIIQDAGDGTVLMFAHMNEEALRKTRETGLIHFYSRSRQKLWMKGETSGETFRGVSLLVDCDQDCLLVKVTANGKGNACHTGRRSCFYRTVDGNSLGFN